MRDRTDLVTDTNNLSLLDEHNVVGSLEVPSPGARRPSRWPPLFLISVLLVLQLFLSSSTIVFAGDLASQLVSEATRLKLLQKEISFSFKLPDGTVVEHLSDRARAPASCMKLIVAAACLDQLGAHHLLQTNLMRMGPVQDGVLEGDLLVVGGGDPAICGRENKDDPLWELRPWCAQIRSQGIKRIRGRILADVRYLEGPAVHPDWPVEQLLRWYCAPSGALNLNDNCIDVVIGPVIEGDVRIKIRPPQPLVRVRSTLVPCVNKKDHLYRVDRRGNGWEILVSGKFLNTSGVRTEWVTVPDPADNFVSIFLQMLRDSGIEVSGVNIPGASRAVPIASIKHSLGSRLPVMLKNSQNLYADSLARVLAKVRGGDGSFSSAADELLRWIQKRFKHTDEIVIRDGSGLSRNNRLTANVLRQVVELGLVSDWGSTLFDSLPLAGIDGTLEKRLVKTPLQGKVRAKTGTINGVVSLAGILDSDQGPVPFCLIYQGRRGRTSAARDWQDRTLLRVHRALLNATPGRNEQ